MKHYLITEHGEHVFAVTTAGKHVFWLENISAELIFTITHPQAHVSIYGTYTLTGTERHTLSIVQHHCVAGAMSESLIRSTLANRAQFHFDGIIRIDDGAGNATASLRNDNLLIGSDAFVTTTPQLEVIPADVSCTHAATVAPIDAQQVHYLMHRGISKRTAQKMIADGFLNDVVARYKAHF